MQNCGVARRLREANQPVTDTPIQPLRTRPISKVVTDKATLSNAERQRRYRAKHAEAIKLVDRMRKQAKRSAKTAQ